MKNSKLRRALTLVACAVLLVCLSVGATLAYLLDDTDAVVNTFTVGNVQIDLDETDVDIYGVKDGETRVKANTYKLLPGHEYIKDPVVHVIAGSEVCYVRVQVTVSDIAKVKAAFPKTDYPTFYNGDLFLLQCLVSGWDNSVWEYKSYENGMYEFWYTSTVDARTATANVDLPAVFSKVVVPTTADGDAIALLNGVTVNVVAHAIQADGFADATAAWAGFEGQVNP